MCSTQHPGSAASDFPSCGLMLAAFSNCRGSFRTKKMKICVFCQSLSDLTAAMCASFTMNSQIKHWYTLRHWADNLVASYNTTYARFT
jgi:hypothetical protein